MLLRRVLECGCSVLLRVRRRMGVVQRAGLLRVHGRPVRVVRVVREGLRSLRVVAVLVLALHLVKLLLLLFHAGAHGLHEGQHFKLEGARLLLRLLLLLLLILLRLMLVLLLLLLLLIPLLLILRLRLLLMLLLLLLLLKGTRVILIVKRFIQARRAGRREGVTVVVEIGRAHV